MDVIRGYVTYVVDGDTFDMDITYKDLSNSHDYDHVERIRIADINAPEVHTPAGVIARDDLKRRILYKTVTVYVDARDKFRRVVGRISL